MPLPAIDADEAQAAAESGRPYTVGTQGSSLRYRVLAFSAPRQDGTQVLALPLDSVDNALARLVTVQAIATATVLALVAAVALVGGAPRPPWPPPSEPTGATSRCEANPGVGTAVRIELPLDRVGTGRRAVTTTATVAVRVP